MPRLPRSIEATKTHEKLHVQHYHDFYDGIVKMFPIDCNGKDCNAQVKPKEAEINKKFDDLVNYESRHIGLEWVPIQTAEQ